MRTRFKPQLLVLLIFLTGISMLIAAENYYLKVRLDSVTLNGQRLSTVNPEIRVAPGSRITGSVTFTVENIQPGSWITPVIWVTSWERGTVNNGKVRVVASDIRATKQFTVNIDVIAPSTPGTYYIGFFAGWMYDADEVASNDHPPKYGDGDDVWDMPSIGWEEVITSGVASTGLYHMPGRAIRILVSNEIISNHVISIKVRHGDGSAVPGAYVCADGTCAYADSTGTAKLTLQQGTYSLKAVKEYDISGTKITYYGEQKATVTGSVSIDLGVMPPEGCFFLRSFQPSKTALQLGETVTVNAEWIFAKCCPDCIVFAVVYDQSGKEIAKLWQGGDAGYTHKVIKKDFTYVAPSSPGTYCLSLNVAYDYSPPSPDQGIIGKTCFTVESQRASVSPVPSPLPEPSPSQFSRFFVEILIIIVIAMVAFLVAYIIAHEYTIWRRKQLVKIIAPVATVSVEDKLPSPPSILSVEFPDLFVDEWGKITIRAKGEGKAYLTMEGEVEWISPGIDGRINLSGETVIDLHVKPRVSGEVPVKITLESPGGKDSRVVTLKVKSREESLRAKERVEEKLDIAFITKQLVGRPLQLDLPSPSITRLDKPLKLGDLECKGYLKTGGFATVLVGSDKFGTNYAVKMPTQVFIETMVRGSPTKIDIDLKPFMREVDVLKSVSGHPCIVRFHAFLDSPPALVFELCRCSLRDVLRQGGLGPVKAAEVLVQIADALAFLHSKGYVHGDVKPENILFSFEGVPKLSDFNTAKALASISKRAPGYTPGYAAPEQLKGEKLTEKADSWALGLVLYETITGKPLLPLDELEYKEAVAKLEKGMLTIGSTGVKEIDELVRLCLRINPAERPSALQIRDALAKYLLSQKISSVTKY